MPSIATRASCSSRPASTCARTTGGRGWPLSAPGFRGFVRTSGADGQRVEIDKGEHDPLRGLTSPSFRKWVPRWTARLRTKAADENPITTMTLQGKPIVAKLRSWKPDGLDGIRLELRRGGKPYEALRVRDVDGKLTVDVDRAPGH